MATLSGAWWCRVSAAGKLTGWDRVGSSTCLSVAAHTMEQIRLWGTLACCWGVKQPTLKHTHATWVINPLEPVMQFGDQVTAVRWPGHCSLVTRSLQLGDQVTAVWWPRHCGVVLRQLRGKSYLLHIAKYERQIESTRHCVKFSVLNHRHNSLFVIY